MEMWGFRGSVCVFALALLIVPGPAAVAAPGDPDSTFSGDGLATVALQGIDEPQAVASGPGGRLLLAGSATLRPAAGMQETGSPAAAQFSADGSLDLGFSGDGLRVEDEDGSYLGAMIQPDGRIILAGSEGTPGGAILNVRRLLANGEPDPSFSMDGRVTFDLGSQYGGAGAGGIVLEPDGNIVISGGVSEPDFPYRSDLFFARLTSGGTLDSSFSGDGKLVVDGGLGFELNDGFVRQADGKFVAAGTTASSSVADDYRMQVVRVTGNGDLDPTFSDDGIQLITFPGRDQAEVTNVMLHPDGGVVVGGHVNGGSRPSFAVAKLTSSGVLDTTFSGDGRQTTFFPNSDAVPFNGSALVQPDGRIVVVGGYRGLLAARYTVDGELDPTFSGDGRAEPAIVAGASGIDTWRSALLQPDGKIVVAGGGVSESGTTFAVARLQGGNDPPDTTAPDTTITGAPESESPNTQPTFFFSSPEAGVTFECSVDNSAFFACTSPHTLNTLGEGPHTFAVRAKDVAGNADPTPATGSVRVTAPPGGGAPGEGGAGGETTTPDLTPPSGSPGTTPDTSGPAVTLGAVTRKKTSIALRVQCPAGEAKCYGTIAVTLKRLKGSKHSPKSLSLGVKAFDGTSTVSFALSKKARKTLKSWRKMQLTELARAQDALENTRRTTSTKTIKL